MPKKGLVDALRRKRGPNALLRDYRDYVEAKIDIDEMPLRFEEWVEMLAAIDALNDA